MDMPDLSVIIVSYRAADRLSQCLAALSGLAGAGLSAEIIVSDNSGGDEGVEHLKENFPGVSFITNSVNGGFGYGCNNGAAVATGRMLLFLNPDAVAGAEALRGLIQAAESDKGNTLVSCRQARADGRESIAWGAFPAFSNLTGVMRAVAGIFEPKKSDVAAEEVFYPDWVSGSVMLISRGDFIKAGGFDDDYWMYYEDVDLCRRIHNQGGRVAFLKNVTIEHNHGGSSRLNLKTTSITKTEVIISRHLYMAKHIRGLRLALIQCFMVVNNLITHFITALAGLLLPFVPHVFVRTMIFVRLTAYYLGALVSRSWVSPRSVNCNTEKQHN